MDLKDIDTFLLEGMLESYSVDSMKLEWFINRGMDKTSNKYYFYSMEINKLKVRIFDILDELKSREN